MNVRALVKDLVPPMLLDLAQRPFRMSNAWKGDYATWAEAMADSSGYDSGAILERVEAAALNVKHGKGAYERDGVLFEQVEYSFPLLSALMWVAAREGRLDVVDFGGALGSSYFQNRRFLSTLPDVRWTVVEQDHFVERGLKSFADERLRFTRTIDAALHESRPNLVVLSSVLQYLEAPYQLIDQLGAFRYAVIDLTGVIAGAKDRLTVQHVPSAIYSAKYPCWFFAEERLRTALEKHFEVVTAFDAYLGQGLRAGRTPANYRGYILERRR